MNLASHAYVHWITSAIDREKNALEAARERMTKYADNRRTPPQAYKVGDTVMLSTSHLKLKRPSRKLDHKFIGPFQIQQTYLPHSGKTNAPPQVENSPHVARCGSRTLCARQPLSRLRKNTVRVCRHRGRSGVRCVRNKGIHQTQEYRPSPCQMARVPAEKDLIFEPYENFSEEVRLKLLHFHINHPSAP